MRKAGFAGLLVCCSAAMVLGATPPITSRRVLIGPTNPKAEKTYKTALAFARRGMDQQALDKFKKADKQDDGKCAPCQVGIVKYGTEFRDWKAATNAAQEEIAEAQEKRDLALAHYDLGHVLFEEGIVKHRSEIFIHSHEEFAKAIAAHPNFPDAWFLDGRALAELKSDAAAKAEFAQFLKIAPAKNLDRERAQRYMGDMQLARERMAPAFAVTTLSGKRVSLDDLAGKVVLLDFWASWCEPCREALPRIKKLAKEFQGKPFVILSVSLDSDPAKWKAYVKKNGMTWLNYRDGEFTGPIAKLFGVQAIPQTFTIDANGVLQGQHIGDASLAGRIKKLVAKAEQAHTEQHQAQ